MRGTSTTWWGREFLEALEQFMDPGRLKRGRSYASDHRLVQFKLELGEVVAKMRGNINPYFNVYRTPYYNVRIRFQHVGPNHRDGILAKLGANAGWVTRLVIGEVPPSVTEAFQGAAVGLLPRRRSELHSSCSCPDWANPCKHVAGAYYRLAELLDHDPLLLFELRGIERSTLFEALAQSEFGSALQGEAEERQPDPGDAAKSPAPPELGTRVSEASPSDMRAFWRGRALPAVPMDERQSPPVSALLLRREADYPEFWPRRNSFLDAMAEVYERVANHLPDGPWGRN